MPTMDVQMLAGHGPGERAGTSANVARLRPDVPPELLVPRVGHVQGAAWPAPGGSADPTPLGPSLCDQPGRLVPRAVGRAVVRTHLPPGRARDVLAGAA